MAGLPKKYAKMGFKKGWAAYKKKQSNKPRGATVARKKKSSSRKKSNKQQDGFIEKVAKKAATPLLSALWGFSREPLNDAIAKSKLAEIIPATRFMDETVGLGLAFGARRIGVAGHWLGRKAIHTVENQEWGSVGREAYTMWQEKKAGSTTEPGNKPGLFIN